MTEQPEQTDELSQAEVPEPEVIDVKAVAEEAEAAGEEPEALTEVPPESAPDETAASESSALAPDDAEAAADVMRPARVTQYRMQRRTQASTAIPAMFMIALGMLYLAASLTPEAFPMTAPLAAGAAVAALGLGLVARFLINGRRERGLCFLGLLLLFWLGLAALAMQGSFDLLTGWPVVIVMAGLALLATTMVERDSDRRLTRPGIGLIVVGGAALPVTMGLIPADILSIIGVYWPMIFVLAAVLMLPRALRDRTRQ